MIKFDLFRDEDPSGISGKGHIATGCIFADGTVAMRWLTRTKTTALYDCVADVFELHGHGGKTRLVAESGELACNKTMGGHELAWTHEDGGEWVVDTLSIHRDAGTKVGRLPTRGDKDKCLNHAAVWVVHSTIECGGEAYMTWKPGEIIF